MSTTFDPIATPIPGTSEAPSYEIIKQSATHATSSSAYTCYISVYRNTSDDSAGVVAASSKYYFGLILQRNKDITRYANKWAMRYVLDSEDTGIQTCTWWDTDFAMKANLPYMLLSFIKELKNDGAAHTVTMLASCEEGAPRGCDVKLTFNTVKQTTKPNAPSGLVLTHNTNELELKWDSVENTKQYRVKLYRKRFNDNNYVFTKSSFVTGSEKTYNIYDVNYIPGDSFYFTVAAINQADVYSNYVQSSHVTIGNAALIKEINNTWKNAVTHVKVTGVFKKVKRIWVKVDDNWLQVID